MVMKIQVLIICIVTHLFRYKFNVHPQKD